MVYFPPAAFLTGRLMNPLMMRKRAWLAALAVAAWGCDKPAPAPPPTPVAAAAATAPATTTAASRPTSSLININGTMTLFPAARLRLESDGQHLVAMLFSDDPRDALKDDYIGNSFYLRMILDIDDAAKLDTAAWHFTAPSSGEKEDSPYGIYLGGRKIALQPFDVRAAFKTTDEGTTVFLSGQFQVLDDSPGRGPAQVLMVRGELPVQVEADAPSTP